jgi:hypothetical protein
VGLAKFVWREDGVAVAAEAVMGVIRSVDA